MKNLNYSSMDNQELIDYRKNHLKNFSDVNIIYSYKSYYEEVKRRGLYHNVFGKKRDAIKKKRLNLTDKSYETLIDSFTKIKEKVETYEDTYWTHNPKTKSGNFIYESKKKGLCSLLSADILLLERNIFEHSGYVVTRDYILANFEKAKNSNSVSLEDYLEVSKIIENMDNEISKYL